MNLNPNPLAEQETILNYSPLLRKWVVWTNVPGHQGFLNRCSKVKRIDRNSYEIAGSDIRSIKYLFKPCDRPGYTKTDKPIDLFKQGSLA